MTRKVILLLAVLLMCGTPVFAQGTTTAPGGTNYLLAIPFAMAIASGLCGLAQGRAIASSAEAIARNPGAGGVIRGSLILGLAFIESLALFTLVIVFAFR
ncbi:MAG TPA: ATP synthase F0 subunit C [Bryobacteraceae bacterium]|nr:ATP synthase F0 subunit C [Bryobacteraceae bacterium]